MGNGRADNPGHFDDDAPTHVDMRLVEAMLGASTGPVDWRSVRSGAAEAAWAALREWVGWFRREFAFDHRVVPPCWYRHPALVSVLSALFDAWRGAYDPLNSPTGAADWHQTLIPLEMRLRDWAARTGCSVGVHRADVLVEHPNDDDQWAAHVAGDVAGRAQHENHSSAPSPRFSSVTSDPRD